MANNMSRLSHKRRVTVLLVAFLAVGGLVIARLAQMQVFCRSGLAQYYGAGVPPGRLMQTTRGTICTSDGKVLARDVPVFNLCVRYERLAEDDWRPWVCELCGVSAEELAQTCEQIVERVERIASRVIAASEGRYDSVQEQRWYHPVVEDIPPEVAALVCTTPDIVPPGLTAEICGKRVYPDGALAPHIVGRCARLSAEVWRELQDAGKIWTTSMPVSEIGKLYRQDDSIGISGMERASESTLRGRRGYEETTLVFHTLRLERRSSSGLPEPGLEVHLTLRADFQRAVNESLAWAAAQPHLAFKSGALVLLDVRDGAVLAAGTWPTYSLETFREDFAQIRENPLSPLLFRPTQAALPTGSVYKLATAIAALEEGGIDPGTTFHCAGQETFAGRRFHCTSRLGHGAMTLIPAIEKSCNVYFYNAGLRAGGPALAQWGKTLGLGVPTGIDLPFERSGQNPEPRSVHGTVNLSIGQGPLLCTPVQVARMCAVIANGGRLVRPHFLDYAVTADGGLVLPPREDAPRIPASEETLRLVREGMRKVVRSGTARRTGLERFDAAGKTGTAEVTDGINHAWFAGFAPFAGPKIAFAVVSERSPGQGGSHAAPIVDHVLENIWPLVEAMP